MNRQRATVSAVLDHVALDTGERTAPADEPTDSSGTNLPPDEATVSFSAPVRNARSHWLAPVAEWSRCDSSQRDHTGGGPPGCCCSAACSPHRGEVPAGADRNTPAATVGKDGSDVVTPPGAGIVIRLLLGVVVHLVANAAGLLVAATLLEGMSVSGVAFVVAVGIFTVVQAVIGPMVRQAAVKNLNALVGGTALVVTFLGLLVTTVVSDGLSIDGVTTWVLATVIVWLAAMVAALLLPVLLAKRAVAERQS
jgi:putative membrane protein